MKLYKSITHLKKRRTERMKMAEIVSSAVASTNIAIKAFGNTMDDLGGVENHIRFVGEKQKKSNTGTFMGNFEIERGKGFLKVWHILTVGVGRDEPLVLPSTGPDAHAPSVRARPKLNVAARSLDISKEYLVKTRNPPRLASGGLRFC